MCRYVVFAVVVVVASASVGDQPEKSPPDAERPRAGNRNVDRPQAPIPEEEAQRPIVIFAKHLLVLDGQAMTWEQARDRLLELKEQGPVYPSFYFTKGAEGANAWGDRISELRRQLATTKTTIGYLSARGSD